jgi:hypothetical protein
LLNAIRKFHSPFTPFNTPFILFNLLPNLGIQTTSTDSVAKYIAGFLSSAFPRIF